MSINRINFLMVPLLDRSVGQPVAHVFELRHRAFHRIAKDQNDLIRIDLLEIRNGKVAKHHERVVPVQCCLKRLLGLGTRFAFAGILPIGMVDVI